MTELPDFMRKYGKTEKNRKSEGISFPVFKRLQVQSGCKKTIMITDCAGNGEKTDIFINVQG